MVVTWVGGGWLGGQLGCSGWLLLAGILAGWAGSLLTASYVLGLFACLNGVGYLLWSSRRRLRLRTAWTLLVLASGVSGAAAIFVLDTAGLWEAIQLEPWIYPAKTSYVYLVAIHLFMFLMLRFGPMRDR